LNSRLINLTQPIGENIPIWSGDPPVTFEDVAWLQTHGYRLRAFSMGEHSGTHINAPAAFLDTGSTIESVPLQLAPAVVFNLSAEAAGNPRCQLTPEHVEHWEAEHGVFPNGAFALLRTDWDRYWREPQRFLASWPAFSSEAVELLLQRGLHGLGTDTHGVDPCDSVGYPINRLVLAHGGVVLEGLRNLRLLPTTGAWLAGGALPLAGGSGAPAVVFALVPAQL